jgi:hypothetical protein
MGLMSEVVSIGKMALSMIGGVVQLVLRDRGMKWHG